jgi:hypothetical protein
VDGATPVLAEARGLQPGMHISCVVIASNSDDCDIVSKQIGSPGVSGELHLPD